MKPIKFFITTDHLTFKAVDHTAEQVADILLICRETNLKVETHGKDNEVLTMIYGEYRELYLLLERLTYDYDIELA